MTWIKKTIKTEKEFAGEILKYRKIAWINLSEKLFRWNDENVYHIIPDAVLNGDFYDEYYYTHGGVLFQALCEEIYQLNKNNNVKRHLTGLEKALKED